MYGRRGEKTEPWREDWRLKKVLRLRRYNDVGVVKRGIYHRGGGTLGRQQKWREINEKGISNLLKNLLY